MSPIRCSLLQRDIPGKRLKQLQTRASLARSPLRSIRSLQCPYGRASSVKKTKALRVPRDDRDSSQSTRSDANKYSRKGMAPMSNGWNMPPISGAIPPPRETEAGSAGKQPAQGYLGLRCANGVSGPCREVSTRVIVFCSLDIGVMPFLEYLLASERVL